MKEFLKATTDNLENRNSAAEKIASVLPENDFQQITENVILNCFPNLEYEARYYFKKPGNHLNEEQYNRIVYMFESNNPPLKPTREVYLNKSKNLTRGVSKIRCKYVNGKQKECIKKTKLTVKDEKAVGEHGIRLAISNETTPLEGVPAKFESERKISRISYNSKDFRYDISEVENHKKPDEYEFEIEYTGSSTDSDSVLSELKLKMKKFIHYLSFGS